MKPDVPQELLDRAALWDDLHRWERRELGKALRSLGLTFGEIQAIVPVPKGTLSNWCASIRLTKEQIAAIDARTPSQAGVPRDSQHRRRDEVACITEEARRSAETLISDPAWTAGVALYWAEGAKTDRRLAVANSDPRLLRVFMNWVITYLTSAPRYSAAINLHADNDEPAARSYWSGELGLDLADFTKTHTKADGTGHRKNHLAFGVCRITLRRGANAWLITMTWIDTMANRFGASCMEQAANLIPGR
jgi:hypothetical protein